MAQPPHGYAYDPATDTLTSDPAEVAAHREDGRPPKSIVSPTHDG